MVTSRAAQPAQGLALVPALLGLVRFAHTVFALPFALAGAFLARMEVPAASRIGWVLLAMAGARSLAMALNRLIDAEIDAKKMQELSDQLHLFGEVQEKRLAPEAAEGDVAITIDILKTPESR